MQLSIIKRKGEFLKKRFYRLKGRPWIWASTGYQGTEKDRLREYEQYNNTNIDLINWTDVLEGRLSKILANPGKWLKLNLDGLMKRFGIEDKQSYSLDQLLSYFIETEVLDTKSLRNTPCTPPLHRMPESPLFKFIVGNKDHPEPIESHNP